VYSCYRHRRFRPFSRHPAKSRGVATRERTLPRVGAVRKLSPRRGRPLVVEMERTPSPSPPSRFPFPKTRPLLVGTESSNPSPSSGESVANSIWAKAASPVRSPPRLLTAPRAGSRAPRSIHCSLRRPSAPTAARSSIRSAGGASFSQLIADGIVAETLPAGTPPGQQRPAEGMAAR
jgi:hypothetical protein